MLFFYNQNVEVLCRFEYTYIKYYKKLDESLKLW